jgi:hypothetical protein
MTAEACAKNIEVHEANYLKIPISQEKNFKGHYPGPKHHEQDLEAIYLDDFSS